MTLLSLVVLTLSVVPTHGNRSFYYNHWHTFPYSPSTQPYSNRRRPGLTKRGSAQDFAGATLVGERPKETTPPKQDPNLESQVPEVSYDNLGPIGKAVAGVTQVVVTTMLEYSSGFFFGFLIGTTVGVPGLLFRPLEPGAPKMLFQEARGRFGRMNSRSLGWGKSWGGISAAFGGFKVAVKVLRNGKEDSWNQILSSAAAGAFFARNGKFKRRICHHSFCNFSQMLLDGPKAMLTGALLYGGMIYIVSGGVGNQRSIQEYTEQPVEF